MKKTAALVTAVGALGVFCVLFVTDARAHSELRRTTDSLASTETHLMQRETDLVSTQAQMKATTSELQTLAASISKSQTDLTASNAAISSTESGLFIGGIDISALNTCLAGVTQALDQVAVGQTTGALSSLGSVSTSCNSARPPPR